MFPKAYGELTNELLGYVGDHDPDLLEGAVRTAAREPHRLGPRTTRDQEATLGTRVAELTSILDEDGYLATFERVSAGTYRIIEHNCAIWAVAQKYGQACTSEIDFIRAVLPDATVERTQHMVAGAKHCAYEIRASAPARKSA